MFCEAAYRTPPGSAQSERKSTPRFAEWLVFQQHEEPMTLQTVIGPFCSFYKIMDWWMLTQRNFNLRIHRFHFL